MNTVELTSSRLVEDANHLLQRLGGVWGAIGAGVTQNVTDPGFVQAIARGPNGEMYFGGRFDDASGLGVKNLVQWDGESFALLQAGVGPAGATADIFDMAVDSTGAVYAVGAFQAMDGETRNRIAKWNGATWEDVGGGTNNTIYCVTVHKDKVYVGGSFTTAGGNAALRIAVWDGSTWAAVGGGISSASSWVYAIEFDANDNMYVGGVFTQAGGSVAVSGIAMWDGTAWHDLNDGIDDGLPAWTYDSVRAIAIAPNGVVYVGGNFTTAGGQACNHVAKWSGSGWSALGVGVNDAVFTLAIDDVGALLAGGFFTSAGGATLSDRVARWNGSAWSNLDIDLPGDAIVYRLLVNDDRLYVGFDQYGDAITSGVLLSTVVNSGSARAYPRFIVSRSGGTGARLEGIRNLTTGAALLFDLELLDGETLTINLAPGNKTITSDAGGNRLNGLLDNSDFGTFCLEAGVNELAVYIVETGAPTLIAMIQWETQFSTLDGAAL